MTHLRFLFVLAALFCLIGCTGEDVLIENTTAPSVVAAKPALAPLEIKPEIDCCWCTMKPDKHNEVRRYGNWDLCEGKSGKFNYLSCRQVRAIGKECTLTKLKTLGRKKFECTPEPLKYYAENGAVAEIAPPDELSGPCRPADWFDLRPGDIPSVHARKGGGGGGDSGSDGGGEGRSFCSCGRDPSDDKNCRAFRVSGGDITVLDVKPIPAGEVNCMRTVCQKIWDFSQFTGVCPPRFEQGPP